MTIGIEELKVFNAAKALKRGSTGAIAAKAGLSRSTASKYLGNLEARGLISCDRSSPPYKYWSIVRKRPAKKKVRRR